MIWIEIILPKVDNLRFNWIVCFETFLYQSVNLGEKLQIYFKDIKDGKTDNIFPLYIKNRWYRPTYI